VFSQRPRSEGAGPRGVLTLIGDPAQGTEHHLGDRLQVVGVPAILDTATIMFDLLEVKWFAPVMGRG
jgi:hypothetical protein